MKRRTSFRFVVLAAAAITLLGCATRPAPDFHGRWKPVNHFSETPEAIPLQQAYAFYASPLDGTLKNMLTRWARDSKMTLSYLHPYDFTLYAPVADLRTSNLQEAVSALNTAYASEHVSVTTDGRQIVVRTTASADQPSAAGTP